MKPAPRELDNALWRALADGTRRWMLDVLRDGPCTTGELAMQVEKDFGLSRCAVMKHLGVLEGAGLIVVRREGRFRWNHINAAPFVAMYRRWVSRFGALPGAAFFDLKDHVEGAGNRGRVMKEIVSDSIVLEYEIAASPARVFEALTNEIGAWWTHSFKKEKKSVRFEPKVGGRFFEQWEGETGALYALVTYLEPPVKLRLTGPMGMSGAVVSAMEFTLEGTGRKTRLTLTHDILGIVPPDEVESYRSGWKELLGVTLREYAERSGAAP